MYFAFNVQLKVLSQVFSLSNWAFRLAHLPSTSTDLRSVVFSNRFGIFFFLHYLKCFTKQTHYSALCLSVHPASDSIDERLSKGGDNLLDTPPWEVSFFYTDIREGRSHLTCCLKCSWLNYDIWWLVKRFCTSTQQFIAT